MGLFKAVGATLGVLFVGAVGAQSCAQTTYEEATKPKTSESYMRRLMKNGVHQGAEGVRGLYDGIKQEAEKLKKDMN